MSGVRPPGFALPDATRPGRVQLQVAELRRSLQFYERVLGFRILDAGDSTATLGSESDPDALVELCELAGARPASPRGTLGLFHFAILLPDRAALGRFLLHASRLGLAVASADHLVSEALYLSDPDGLGIEVYADRPRASWRTVDGQIAMATEPLDRPALARVAGEVPWTGLPAGSRIGHVHLRVGSLPEAEAFYHRALGLDKTVWNYPGALFLSAGGYHHHLGVNTWAGAVSPAKPDDSRLLEWELVLPSEGGVARAAATLESSGIPVEHAGGDLVCADPWGTRVRLRAERPAPSAS